MKLILSCLKQILTLTLEQVTSTGAITLEKKDGAKEALAAVAAAVAEIIAVTAQSNV